VERERNGLRRKIVQEHKIEIVHVHNCEMVTLSHMRGMAGVQPDTRSRRKRCQPFLYDSPGTLERGTQRQRFQAIG
jgi:hypothetical protein